MLFLFATLMQKKTQSSCLCNSSAEYDDTWKWGGGKAACCHFIGQFQL